jgi:hypothetical protein
MQVSLGSRGLVRSLRVKWTVRPLVRQGVQGGVALLDGIAARRPSPACSTGRGSASFSARPLRFGRSAQLCSIEWLVCGTPRRVE